MATNITWHEGAVSRAERQQFTGQKGFTLWFTGLSASGKSTLASALEQRLLQLGYMAYRLDGDNVRFGLNKDLGFVAKDREENIRRISEVAKLFADACVISLTSFISPFQADRDVARKLHEDNGIPFVEIYVDASLGVLEQRDPKGLYKRAKAGEIKDFTGISSPYEPPPNPELHIQTDSSSIAEGVEKIFDYIIKHGLIVQQKKTLNILN